MSIAAVTHQNGTHNTSRDFHHSAVESASLNMGGCGYTVNTQQRHALASTHIATPRNMKLVMFAAFPQKKNAVENIMPKNSLPRSVFK
jgi:hypothetical protein